MIRVVRAGNQKGRATLEPKWPWVARLATFLTHSHTHTHTYLQVCEVPICIQRLTESLSKCAPLPAKLGRVTTTVRVQSLPNHPWRPRPWRAVYSTPGGSEPPIGRRPEKGGKGEEVNLFGRNAEADAFFTVSAEGSSPSGVKRTQDAKPPIMARPRPALSNTWGTSRRVPAQPRPELLLRMRKPP